MANSPRSTMTVTAPPPQDGSFEEHAASKDTKVPAQAAVSEGNDAQITTNLEAGAATQPQRPIHSAFSSQTKAMIVVMTAFGSLFSPLSSQIYLPSLDTMATAFHVSVADINLTMTTYMILQGIAPIFMGDLADQAGRRPVYIICFTIYFFANLGLALQRNFAALLVLRALQSCGSSGTIALGYGVTADIVTSAERGSYVAWVQLGTQLGPALAPTLGGILAQFLGWPSIFWFLLIAGGIYLVAYVILVPETARSVVGDGSLPPQGWNLSMWNIYQNRESKAPGPRRTDSKDRKRQAARELAKGRKVTFPNPLNALRIIVEKDVSLVLLYASFMVTGFFCVLVPFPTILEEVYGFNDLQKGLCYLPFSFGAAGGGIFWGRFLDYNYRRTARKLGLSIDRKRGNDLRHFPVERARLEVVWYPAILGAVFTIAWGWVLHARTSIAAPLVVLFFAGFFLSGGLTMLTSLLVDLYPQSPATAMGSLNLCRCSMSAGGTAVIQYIIDAWGLGWTYTFVGLLVLCSSPCLWMVMKWGPRWREERYVREEKKKLEKLEKREKKDQATK